MDVRYRHLLELLGYPNTNSKRSFELRHQIMGIGRFYKENAQTMDVKHRAGRTVKQLDAILKSVDRIVSDISHLPPEMLQRIRSDYCPGELDLIYMGVPRAFGTENSCVGGVNEEKHLRRMRRYLSLKSIAGIKLATPLLFRCLARFRTVVTVIRNEERKKPARSGATKSAERWARDRLFNVFDENYREEGFDLQEDFADNEYINRKSEFASLAAEILSIDLPKIGASSREKKYDGPLAREAYKHSRHRANLLKNPKRPTKKR